MDKRLISVLVTGVYLVAGIIMVARADYEWATVQFALAFLAYLTSLAL